MKNIVCVGDSHTWGQGAGKFWGNYNPPVNAGDHRQADFNPPFYVNLLRSFINGKSSSACGEITREKSLLIQINGVICDTPFISITKGKIRARIVCSMFRLQFKCGKQGAKANIIIDGSFQRQICTLSEEDSQNDYRLWIFDGLPDREHVLEIEIIGDGRLDLYRLDYYSGEYAVINSGVGSCHTEKFLANYWRDYVEEYKPYLLVIEGFSINDWIHGTPLDRYSRLLTEMFEKARQWDGKSLLLTVSPILGKSHYAQGCPEYSEYIANSIKAAQNASVPVADAHKEMVDLIHGISEEDKRKMLFEDDWHVNTLGHNIYFQCICSLIEKHKLL